MWIKYGDLTLSKHSTLHDERLASFIFSFAGMANLDMNNRTRVISKSIIWPNNNMVESKIIDGYNRLSTSWLPFPKAPEHDIENQETKKKEQTAVMNNTGNYEFEITVTETNPYKIKAQNKEQMTEKYGDSATVLLKAIGKLAFPDEQDKK